MHLTLSRRTLSRLLTVAALAVTAFAFSAGSGAADSFYTWPGAVILHVHTTPADSSPGYVQSNPYYIDCPNACDRPYDPGQKVSLWAFPTGGFAFTSWTTGPCAGSTANPCAFTITADTDVTADFSGHYVPTPPNENNTLTVFPEWFVCCGPVGPKTTPKVPIVGLEDLFGSISTADGEIGCSVFDDIFSEPNDCSGNFAENSTVTLNVDTGNPFCVEFVGWLDGGNGTSKSYVMNGNEEAVPGFLLNPICLI